MTACCNTYNQTSNCCSTFAAACSSARISLVLDTVIMAVSLIIVRISLVLRLRT